MTRWLPRAAGPLAIWASWKQAANWGTYVAIIMLIFSWSADCCSKEMGDADIWESMFCIFRESVAMAVTIQSPVIWGPKAALGTQLAFAEGASPQKRLCQGGCPSAGERCNPPDREAASQTLRRAPE